MKMKEMLPFNAVKKSLLLLCVSLFSLSIFTAYSELPYYHIIRAIGADYAFIRLEDGSVWQIHPHYRSLLRDWEKGDPVLICPNHRFESCFADLMNTYRKTHAGATIAMGPISDSPYALQLTYCDPELGKVCLTNNRGEFFSYQVEPKDLSYLNDWEVGQLLIIGTNDWSLARVFSNCKNILINPEYNHFIRAQLE